MKPDMRRGTPSAELFGGLLRMIRTAGTRGSMRQIGDRIKSPAATVSQVEKGQRALKRDRIEDWAAALEVDSGDLLELWLLTQGEVAVDDLRKFYTTDQALAVLSTDPVKTHLAATVTRHPELEPIYRLAQAIADVLKRVLPEVGVQVDPPDFEPLYMDKMAFDIELTGEEQDEQAEHAAVFVALPFIECYWDERPGNPRPWDPNARDRVRVPLLQPAEQIVRRRAKSMDATELEDLIGDLSGPERDRVRGYIEAIVEHRTDSDG